MQNPIQKKYQTCFVLALLAILAACSSGDAQLEGELFSTERRLKDLTSAIEGGSLRNASMIKQYSRLLQKSRPELKPLLIELEKEASTSNPLYQSLQDRYKVIRDETESFDSWVEKVEELKRIQSAADLGAYNDALSDTVNVIADLSKGELARVNAVSKKTELSMNESKDFGAGSQYMGNPHYGHWSHGSGGSYWAWYGQYRFFGSMFGNNRYYYNDWAGRRGYSYYSDIGRNSYTSRSQRAGQRDVASRAKKQFGSSGNFKSPYSKSRTGATGMSKASSAQQKSAFKSPYSKSTASTSKYQSSTRNSGFRTSRGTSRGK
ncbi:MAG: hypothetical protein ABGY96_05085 [bacterium]|nr:hypothetical protein [Gammaproteobacteria bacterium]HIL96045.1 hypothetical protein [Pseudomonadales bacterium]